MNVVAPHAGVWIEICKIFPTTFSGVASLPTRECGLKFERTQFIDDDFTVAPHAGVWIEIFISLGNAVLSTSLPTRECGLKSLSALATRYCQLSLPTRECGLKYDMLIKLPEYAEVAPHAGVWESVSSFV